MMTLSKKARVTIDILLSNGFIEYHKGDESKPENSHISYPSPMDDIYGERILFEADYHRNLFVVTLDEEETIDCIYIQEDAGCGFVCMPLRWSEITVQLFNSLYFAFMGKHKITQEVINVEAKENIKALITDTNKKASQ